MTPGPLRACLAALILAAAMPAFALSKHFNHETMMPSSEIKRGMKAVGKSVFYGTEIAEFNLEVFGVLERAGLGKDLVIAKVLDGPVVERKCGIMGGMSGSPVYIDGRLIGAIAYTWSYEIEPVAGITTIDSMLEALDKPEDQEALSPFGTSVQRFSSRRGVVEVAGKRISQVRVVPRAQAQQAFADAHTMIMHRVTPPVYCSGLPEQAMEYLRGVLEPHGMEPIAGPGAKRDPVDVDLVPGAAFGMPLVSGDFDISTGGTITYREGDIILGFGHPFMELGNVELPMTTSWIHDFIPRYSRTDKLMSPMEEVGVITQDRGWSVGGKVGPRAAQIPATFKITDETRDLTKTYKVSVLKHRDISAGMLASAAVSSLFATYNSPGEGMVRTKLRIRGDKGHELVREDIRYHSGFLIGAAIGSLREAGAILARNRFAAQDVAEVEYEATLSDADNTAAIEGLYVEQPVAKAGEDLTIHVRLRPDCGGIVEKTISLPMPLGLQQGRLRIGVSGGADAMALRGRVGILPPAFYSLEGIITEFKRIERGDRLFVAAGTPAKHMSVRGAKLLHLPRTMEFVIGGARRTDIVRGGAEISRTLDVPWVIYGSAGVTLPTEDREGRKGKAPPAGGAQGKDNASLSIPPAPAGIPPGLWWAASAFARPGSDDADRAPDHAYRLPTLPRANSASPGKDSKKEDGKKGEADKKTDKKTEDKDDAKKEEGAVARKPSIWSQTTAEDFAGGEPKNVAIRSDGALQLAAEWAQVAEFSEAYVCSLAAAEGAVYAGAFSDGNVYRLDADKAPLLFSTGEFGVSALCPDKGGALLAGTLPNGRIFRIAKDGTGREFCRIEGSHIWDIVSDGGAGYYVGVGPGAAVYHVDGDGAAERLVDIRQSHAMRLLLVGEDLYIATAQNGVLYRLGPDGDLVSVFDAGKNEIMALVPGPKHTILLGTVPEGKVVAISAKGAAMVLYENKKAGVLSIACAEGRIFAGLTTEGQIVEIMAAQTRAVLRDDDGSQIMALCADGSRLYAATANPGSVLCADLSAAAEGELESAVLDAKRTSLWGRVDWDASVHDGSRLALRVRSGNSTDPKDGSWSDWSPQLLEPGRDRAMAPPAQFLQYRVEMGKGPGVKPPRLNWIRVSYLPANQKPLVKEAKPKEGQGIRGKFKLEWKMEDPDKDTLQAKLLIRPRGKRDFKTIKEHITKSEYVWDTKSTDDGVYDLRIVVDDSLANPVDARTAALDIANVTVDNTAPEVEIISGPAKQPNGAVALTGFALDAHCPIANVAWQAKGESVWRAVRLDDGLYDWRYERFLIVTHPLKESVTEISIRARDAAGNVTDKTVKLPKEKKPEPEG